MASPSDMLLDRASSAMCADQVSHPLIVNLLGPDGIEETVRRQTQQGSRSAEE